MMNQINQSRIINTALFYYSLLIVILIIGSCKEKITPIDCGSETILVDGKCQCPKDKIEHQRRVNNESNAIHCYEKEKGRFSILSSDFECFKNSNEHMLLINMDNISNPDNWDERFNAFDFSYHHNYAKGTLNSSAFYFPHNDSLHFHIFTQGSATFDCKEETASFAIGKFHNNKNKIELKIYFHNEPDGLGNKSNATDSFTVWFSNHYE